MKERGIKKTGDPALHLHAGDAESAHPPLNP